jgi:hypothetical protein
MGTFIIGLMLGAAIGIGVMCLMIFTSDQRDD